MLFGARHRRQTSRIGLQTGECWCIRLDHQLTSRDRRKVTTKKNKTWEGDCYIKHEGKNITMISTEGKVYVNCSFVSDGSDHAHLPPSLTTGPFKGTPLFSGYTFLMSGKEIGIDAKIRASEMPRISGSTNDRDDFEDLTRSSPAPVPLPTPQNSVNSQKTFVPLNGFYGTMAPKPKPKGPLYASCSPRGVIICALTKQIDMTLMRRTP
jgi:DNA repair and recombination protein RAD54B